MSLIIHEIDCKSAISKSALPCLSYAINPYRGCVHGCIYCYAPSILHESRIWGEFIDVKINIINILKKELPKLKSGTIGIGTVTDPYQEPETKYKLTRKCLDELLKYDYPISIQTKSVLILRDIDLIERFAVREIGITITTIDDNERKKYEGGSSIDERLNALRDFKNRGIKTWVFFGPILPGISDSNQIMKSIISKLSDIGIDYVFADRLNLKRGTWENIKTFIEKEHPQLMTLYEDLFLRGNSKSYYNKVFSELRDICRNQNVELKMAFEDKLL